MKIQVFPLIYEGKKRIGIRPLGFDKAFPALMKKIPGSRWTPEEKCWHIPDIEVNHIYLREQFRVEIPKKALNKRSISSHPPYISSDLTEYKIRVAEENKSWLKVYVPREQKDWIRRVKEIPGRHWDWERKYWRVPYVKESLRILRRQFSNDTLFLDFEPRTDIAEHYIRPKKEKTVSGKTKAVYVDKRQKKLHKEQRDALILLEEQLRLRRYSYNTIKTYRSLFTSFLLHYPAHQPVEITGVQIKDYLLHLIQKKGISESTQNQVINAIKFYYEKVLNQERKTYYVQRPKKSRPLPEVLSEPDVVRILKACENIKHKCILVLVYSAGLRLGEVVNLKVWDIRYDRRQVFIKGGKGKKDRYSILSEAAIKPLQKYTEQYRPDDWLFEGQYGGQYSKRSVQQVFKLALKKSGVTQRATLHTLRHSFATHLLEKGVNLRYIQELLGHNSSKTTEIYTHITKKGIEGIKSPLDYLDLD